MHEVGCSIPLSCFFSRTFFNSFCLLSLICFPLVYLQYLPHYLFTRNYFPLHDIQRNRTNFSFSNTFAVLNQVAHLWSCAVASFWDFKITCAPSIIWKAVHCLNNVFNFIIKRVIMKQSVTWQGSILRVVCVYSDGRTWEEVPTSPHYAAVQRATDEGVTRNSLTSILGIENTLLVKRAHSEAVHFEQGLVVILLWSRRKTSASVPRIDTSFLDLSRVN